MILLTKRGNVAVLTLARSPVNAIDTALLDGLEGAYQRIRADPSIRAVVVRSAQRFFSPGVDISMIDRLVGDSSGADSLLSFNRRLQGFYAMWEGLELATVAALEGTATGGGLEFALACDLRVVARDTKIGLPEAKIGLVPGAGGTQRLTRIAGLGTAARLILTGELVSGAEAERLGIVHKAVDPNDVEMQAFNWANGLAAVPRTTIAAIKHCLALAPSEAGFVAEVEGTARIIAAADSQRLIKGFLEGHAEGHETIAKGNPDEFVKDAAVPIATSPVSGREQGAVIGR